MNKPGLVEATAAAPTLTAPTIVRLLIALAVVTRLVPVLLSPEAWLNLGWLSDGAAASALIARRLLDGHLLSFDDGSVTNGAAPLWLLLELPVVAVKRHGMLPLQGLGVLQALLAAPAAVLIARLAEPRGQAAVRLALLLWAVAPVLVIGTLDAGVGSVAALMVLWLLDRQRALMGRADPRHDVDLRITLGFGALCGLAALARPDLLLLALPLLVHRLWLLAERGLRTDELVRVATFALVGTALVFGPWLVLSAVTTGEVLPTSLAAWGQSALERGWANLPVEWQPNAADPFDPEQVPLRWRLEHLGLLVVVFVLQHPLLAWLRPSTPFTPDAPPTEALFDLLPGGVVLLVALCTTAWALRRWLLTLRPRPSLVGPLAAWAVGLCVFGPWVAPSPPAFDHLVLPLIVGTLPLWAGQLVDDNPLLPGWRRPVGLAVAGLVVVIQVVAGGGAVQDLRKSGPSGPGPVEGAVPEGALAAGAVAEGSVLAGWAAVAPTLDAEARLGTFNLNAVAWLADRSVVNLDGAYSAQALDARRRGKLAAYVCSRGVDVVLVRGPQPPAALLAERPDFIKPLWKRNGAALSAWAPDCPRATDPDAG